jgi:FkbM family methyltransferase
MGLQNSVKQLLRHCGHAIVSTVHDRLNGVEMQLGGLEAQSAAIRESQNAAKESQSAANESQNSINESQTALLQSSIYLVEAIREIQSELKESQTALRQSSANLIEVLQQIQRGIDENQAALRHPSAYLVEVLRQIQTEVQRQCQELERLHQRLAEPRPDDLAERLTGLADSTELAQAALVKSNLIRQQDEQQRQAELSRRMQMVVEAVSTAGQEQKQGFQEVSALQSYVRNVFEQEMVRQVCVETPDYHAVNPETELIEYLYSFLPTHKVLDIGAHIGDVSEHLLESGYEVFAFEPFSASFQKLTSRFAAPERKNGFHPHNFALGSAEGNLPLHLAEALGPKDVYQDATAFHSLASHSMPDDLPFVRTVMVPVRTLAALHRDGLLPADISLAKIDTEGYDLEVIRGMEDVRYPVVMAEYWDREIPFGESGLLYTLDTLIEEMRRRGYAWHIVIYRVWGSNQRAFYCNHNRPVPKSWGNVIFFQKYDVFAQAQTWCSATLPRTFFKAAQSVRSPKSTVTGL